MKPNLIQIKITRLGFYLGLYVLPALLALSLVQPQAWLKAVLLTGLIPGLWRSLRRASRKGRVEPLEILTFSLTTAALSLIVAGTSTLLGWMCLPCWALVAVEQAYRRESKRGLAYPLG